MPNELDPEIYDLSHSDEQKMFSSQELYSYNPRQCAYCKSLNTRFEHSRKAPLRQHCLDCGSIMDGDYYTFFDDEGIEDLDLHDPGDYDIFMLNNP